MIDTERKRKVIISIVYLAIMVTIGFFAIRYALGVCFPFVLAFLIAIALQKPKNFLVRKTFLKQGSASAICVFLLIVFFSAIMSLIGIRLIQEFRSFIDYIILRLQDVDSLVNTFEVSVFNIINSLPEFAVDTVKELAESFFTQIREYLAGESSDIVQDSSSLFSGTFSLSWLTTPLNGVITTAAAIPTFLVSVVITLVACCFMTSDYDMIIQFFMNQFSQQRQNDILRGKQILKSSMAKIGKAYLLIIGVTFIEVSLGLGVLSLIGVFNSSYLFVIAAITSIIDIIPVLGTGTIIVPWAIYSLIMGETGLGIGLLVLYATITVIRQIIEPKLVAGQLGLSPILTIGAMYFGVKIIGFAGIFVGPILIIMLKLLNDEGIINLWKRGATAEESAQSEIKDTQPQSQEKSVEQVEK